jgi:DNA-directed RNA polymerase subunit H (RpoH/RPB5)
MNNKEIVVKSFQTVVEMLSDRALDIGELTPHSAHELLEVFVTNNKQLFEVVINDIKIVYCLSSKIKWSEFKKHFEDEKPYSLYILIVKDKLTQNNAKMLSSLKMNLQQFDIKSLQFNISKHELVPKHELVRDENEVKDIVSRYSLKSKFQLPIILKTDAMAKYLGLKNGDVVKITRVSQTSGEYIVYRCCV